MPKKKTTKKAVSKKSKKAVKKSAAKKTKKTTSAKKKTVKRTIPAGKKKLMKDLDAIVRDLDMEGIEFLIKQAAVLQHNQRVQEIKKQSSMVAVGEDKKDRIPSAKRNVTVKEGDDKSYFVININNYGSFFSLAEMRKLVSLCHKSSDAKDAALRIYNWLKKERSDVIRNNAIDGQRDPLLSDLYEVLISHYTVKK